MLIEKIIGVRKYVSILCNKHNKMFIKSNIKLEHKSHLLNQLISANYKNISLSLESHFRGYTRQLKTVLQNLFIVSCYKVQKCSP